MTANKRLVLFWLSAVFAVGVFADDGSSLNGTWVADEAAAVQYVRQTAPQVEAVQLARSFFAMKGYLATSAITFNDGVATLFVYGDASGRGEKFKLVSQVQAQRKYIASDDGVSEVALIVTVLNGDYIRVSKPNDPPGSFVVWKRASPVQSHEAVDAHLAAWRTSMDKIQNYLFEQDLLHTDDANPKSWSEDVALHDGRRIKVAREVSYTYRRSRGDAGSGFAVFNNRLGKFRLQFNHPETRKVIVWQGEPGVRPILLDVLDGVPYLVLSARPTKETERAYGCTELPYIYLRRDTNSRDKWRFVPEEYVPPALKNANLSFADETQLTGHVSVDEVQGTIVRKEESSDRFIQHDIPTNYSEWRYLYKNDYRERRRDDCRAPRALLGYIFLF